MKRTLLVQAAIVGLACDVIAVATFGRIAGDSFWIQAGTAAFVALAAPVATGWDRRLSAQTAIFVPSGSVIVVNAFLWASTAAHARSLPSCRELPTACEGYGILLAFWPFVAGALVLVAVLVGGLVRLVAWLLRRSARGQDCTRGARANVGVGVGE